MVIKTVVHFEIPAGDLGKLRKFYSDVFGWKFEKAPMPDMEYWMITTGPRNRSVGGGMYEKNNENDRPRNFIGVEEIDKAIESFKAAGGTELVGKQEVPGMGWSFIGTDPEGNTIALWEAATRRQARRAKRSTRRSRRTNK
jgi:uncharacterized protein